ncbi:MAG: iron uptake porin [Pseudanabaena sp. ELA607]
MPLSLSPSSASAEIEKIIPDADIQSISTQNGDLSQLTLVYQLGDVRSTDWAFTALQSLVERYGCIAGYPDRTYRGNKPLSRYEFAAGLNACLNKINEIISAGRLTDKVSKEDLATLQRLQSEFAADLATVRGRVNALDAKVAKLEAQQFSTTTKLNGEVIALLVGSTTSGKGSTNNTTLGYRTRLNLNTSFTGKDNLNIRLSAQNAEPPIAPSVNETRLLYSQSTGNTFVLDNLIYSFPVVDNLRAYVGTAITDVTYVGVDPVTPLNNSATGAISNFAKSNPALYTQATGAGASLRYKFGESLAATVGYIAENRAAQSPTIVKEIDPNTGVVTTTGGGLTGGGRTIFANINAYLGQLNLGLFYANTFSPSFGVDTRSGSIRSTLAFDDNGDIRGIPISANTGALQFRYDFSPRVQLAGWFGYTSATATGFVRNAEVINYAVQLVLPDLFSEGNLAAFTFGQQPTLVKAGVGVPLDRATGFHLEASYRFQVSKNISITPGIIYLTRPNQDRASDGGVIGVIRSSFTF